MGSAYRCVTSSPLSYIRGNFKSITIFEEVLKRDYSSFFLESSVVVLNSCSECLNLLCLGLSVPAVHT